MTLRNSFLLFITLFFSNASFSQEWESVSPFPEASTHHAIGFSYNEMGYIVTGSNTVIANKFLYQYNSLTDTWTQKEDFPGETRSYAIGDFYNGKQYIGFGANFTGGDFLKDLWSYDPSNDTWEELASCPCNPRMHPSFNALNGKIYVGLGTAPTSDAEDFWAYDIESNTWSQKASFIGGKTHHPYHFSLGEYVYVGLGHNHSEHLVNNTWYRYDPLDDTWTQLNDLPAEGRVAGTQFHHKGYGYALSGSGDDLTNGFHHAMEEGEFWRYDSELDSWTQLTSHPGPSRYAPASFVIDDYVYIVSGLFDNTEQTETMRIKLETVNRVSDKSEMGIRIFPNPSVNNISIYLDDQGISSIESAIIYGADGKLVLSQQNLEGSSIDVSSLENGIYYLIISIDGIKYSSLMTKS